MDTCLRAVRTDQEKVRQNNGTEPAYSLLHIRPALLQTTG